MATAQLIYKVYACLLGDWVIVCLESFSQGEAMKWRKFVEELNVRDKTKGSELNLLFL